MLALRFVLDQADIDLTSPLSHVKPMITAVCFILSARVCEPGLPRAPEYVNPPHWLAKATLRRKGSGNRDVLRLLRRSLAISQTNT